MPVSPSLRRRRLALMLLRRRAELGMTVEAVAKEAKQRAPSQSWSGAKITRIESRKRQHLSQGEVTTLLDVYTITDADERESYLRLAREARLTGWWTGYSDILGQGAYVDLETEASHVRTYEPMVIPGLLQTADYARATIRSVITSDEQEVSRRVEVRAMRRQTLERPEPMELHAVIDESALRKIPGEVAAEQLRHLVEMQRRKHVTIQVMPDSAGLHAGVHGAFVLMGFAHDPPLAYLEQSLGGLFLEEPEELAHYDAAFAAIRGAALAPRESVAFLDQQAKISLDQSH